MGVAVFGRDVFSLAAYGPEPATHYSLPTRRLGLVEEIANASKRSPGIVRCSVLMRGTFQRKRFGWQNQVCPVAAHILNGGFAEGHIAEAGIVISVANVGAAFVVNAESFLGILERQSVYLKWKPHHFLSLPLR